MKLRDAFEILYALRHAISTASYPTLKDVYKNPSLIWSPSLLSRTFMSHLWSASSDGSDEYGRPDKQKLITPNAQGVVLDIGAGYGHTLNYLDRKRVTQYVALEPNSLMHDVLRQTANSAGYYESDGSLVIIGCGAEDLPTIRASLGNVYSVDMMISVLSLCSIPHPEKTLTSLVRDVLKPGGQFVFYEHVRSRRKDVAWWQSFWAPIWSVFLDGCRLDRPTDELVASLTEVDDEGEKVSLWSEGSSWAKPGEDENGMLPHHIGRFVKYA